MVNDQDTILAAKASLDGRLEGVNITVQGRFRGDLKASGVVKMVEGSDVDAKVEDIERWYIKRFLALRKTSFADPQAHFHHYSNLSDEHATIAAEDIWNSINRPNLVENILPTRPRATLVLRKDADHSINRLRLRKL